MKNILIISQARYDSTRLPGKVLLKIQNKPLLWYVIRRLERVKTPNQIIIATAKSPSNKPIIEFAKENGINYYVGSENDVLDRYYQAAKKFKGEIIVRITSDCPLMDPNLIDYGLNMILENAFDYVSNVHPPTYPDGFDIEIFSFDALKKTWNEAKKPSDREHVTPYIWNNPDKFIIGNYENDVDLSNLRLTVDTKEDFILISTLIEKFYDNWSKFTMNDIINYLKENPELLKINSQYNRNEGYLKSLKKDRLNGFE